MNLFDLNPRDVGDAEHATVVGALLLGAVEQLTPDAAVGIGALTSALGTLTASVDHLAGGDTRSLETVQETLGEIYNISRERFRAAPTDA